MTDLSYSNVNDNTPVLVGNSQLTDKRGVNGFNYLEILKEVSEEAIAADKAGWHKVEDGIATKLIENIDFGRISAQAAKQVIIQKVREAERSKITQKYESLVGEVISGQVKRINRE